MSRRVKLYIEEEQEILREAFKVVLPVVDPDIDLLKVSGPSLITRGRTEDIPAIFDVLAPNVVLLGLRSLEDTAANSLATIRKHYPSTGFVVLCAYYCADSIKYLKYFLKKGSQKGAYLYKHSVDSVAEFSRVIHAVAEGRLIIDPILFQSLMVENNIQNSVLKSLTQRELEILGWMAKGYRNASIAEVLSLEPKTVENHINNIFSKLSEYIPNARHSRVAAVISYLRATGSMVADLEAIDPDMDTFDNSDVNSDVALSSGLGSLALESGGFDMARDYTRIN